MNHVIRLAAMAAMLLVLTETAHAVFSSPVPAPAPGALGLLAAGGIGVMAARFLSRRKHKRDE